MEKLKFFTPVAAYALVLGMVYSFSFWGRFFINPLQFASAVDVAKIAAWPLSASVLMALTHFLISGLGFEEWSVFTHVDGPLLLVEPKWLKTIAKIIWDGCFVALLLWLALSVSTPFRWFGIGFCAMVLISKSIEKQSIIRKILPNYQIRSIAIFFTIFAPFVSIGVGAVSAETIKSGRASLILDEDQTTLPSTWRRGNPRQFVGTLGGYYVFYSGDKSLAFFKPSDGQAITLKNNPAVNQRGFLF
ncbi:hypothetical protein [Paraburkholderia phytofirmans]|uniref:Uncharacterized protein n=1 Tax=Paraburkholderia phytofirmans TaxID=261302 RepID=A0ABW9BIP8_9BURK